MGATIGLLAAKVSLSVFLAWGNAMRANEAGAETRLIEELTDAGAQVEESGAELTVFLARTDRLLELASRLERMTKLDCSFWLGGPVLTGSELRHLRGHKRLREIDVTNMPISGEHLDVLSTLPNLEVLNCTPKSKGKEALVHIGKCKKLRVLRVYGGQVPDDALEQLRSLKELEELTLTGNPVSDGLRVARYLRRLRELSVTDTRVTDDALAALSELPHLTKVFVGGPNLTDAGVQHLSRCSTIERLAIASQEVTADGLANLRRMPRLVYLDLEVPLTEAQLLEDIPKIHGLKSFLFPRKRISEEARNELEAILPQCCISWLGADDE